MKNPRTLAYSILCDVYLNGQFANLALKQRLQTRTDQDKNLISALVYTTLLHGPNGSIWLKPNPKKKSA
jgi:hypothetical protein